jgi:hypothetical protein
MIEISYYPPSRCRQPLIDFVMIRLSELCRCSHNRRIAEFAVVYQQYAESFFAGDMLQATRQRSWHY